MKQLRVMFLVIALIFTAMLTAACESGETPSVPEKRERMIPPTSILRSDMGTQKLNFG